jgi:hypothetical protein
MAGPCSKTKGERPLTIMETNLFTEAYLAARNPPPPPSPPPPEPTPEEAAALAEIVGLNQGFAATERLFHEVFPIAKYIDTDAGRAISWWKKPDPEKQAGELKEQEIAYLSEHAYGLGVAERFHARGELTDAELNRIRAERAVPRCLDSIIETMKAKL